MKYLRVYSDESGESHFDEVDVPMQEVNYAPPAPPVQLSAFMPAAQVGFMAGQPGWVGDWHPVPQRQMVVLISGELELDVSDGETRRMHPGDVALSEDTSGKGHRSRAVGHETTVLVVVALPPK
jgi:quercetin dioxygenase-like cupin family protein